MRTKGEGAEAFKYVRKKVPFYMYFVMFSYARYFYHTLQSSVTTFITVLRTSAMIIFLFLNCFTAFFFMELLIGYLKTFLTLNIFESSDISQYCAGCICISADR